MKGILVSVAPVAAEDTVNVPEQIARDVIDCWHAGASMVHLHCRDARGALTPDTAHLGRTVALIRAESPIVMEISTGGVSSLTIAERCAPCAEPFTECCSLNVGSVNLGRSVYCNPIDDVRYCVEQIARNQIVPEVEVFEPGMIHTTRGLWREFGFAAPPLFAIVLGHEGAMPATEKALDIMLDALEAFFPGAPWGITQARRADWTLVRYALSRGASCVRIGFEDSRLLADGSTAASNAEQVRELAALLAQMQMRPADIGEARRMLGLTR